MNTDMKVSAKDYFELLKLDYEELDNKLIVSGKAVKGILNFEDKNIVNVGEDYFDIILFFSLSNKNNHGYKVLKGNHVNVNLLEFRSLRRMVSEGG